MHRVLAILCSLLAFSCAAQEAKPEYRLVWSDEFEVDGKPDAKKWGYERGFVRNRELQWYQAENAFCKDGRLIIEGRRERKPNPDYKKGSKDWQKQRKHIEYTSACLVTKGLHDWRYGRFEVKAKISAKNGLWPAIWFHGAKGEWPSCGEIDLMEYYQGHLYANACWGTRTRWVAKWDSSKKAVASFGDKDWDNRFHIWRMDWNEDSIRLYVDDQLLNTIDLTRTINPTDRGPRNPFHHAHYLMINLAIGGDGGGDASKTAFPSRFEIEYVRVYQIKGK